MKIQKFNSTALVRILNQYKYPPKDAGVYGHLERTERIDEKRSEIIEARDSWLAGEDLKPKSRIKIYEDGDKVILETLDHKFRISGNLVTKEESI